MLEHSFYQALNLVQALYLHWLGSRAGGAGLLGRLAGCLAATSPWLLRGLFPVNSFSDNYASGTPAAARAWTFIGIMYRTKKWQYGAALQRDAAWNDRVHLLYVPHSTCIVVCTGSAVAVQTHGE